MVRFLISLMIAATAFADIIPADRIIPFLGNVGIPGGIPDTSGWTVYQTISAGAAVTTVQSAINGCPSNQVVQLSNGNYTWNDDLRWDGHDGVVVRGSSSTNVHITFTAGNFYMRGQGRQDAALSVDAPITVDTVKGDTNIILSSVPAWVTVGELLGIDQLSDTNIVSELGTGASPAQSYRDLTTNGVRGLGQLVKVTSKTATTIGTEVPLTYAFKVSKSAEIWQPHSDPSTQPSLKACGLQGVTATWTTSGGIPMLQVENAERCWGKDVAFTNAPGGIGIWILFSYRCQFEQMDLRDSQLLGGGQGYGISPWHYSFGCLIWDSIFARLHNAMTCNASAQGNVFAFNFEAAGVSDANQNPGMNTHSVHPYMNLWEGNWCEDKMLLDWNHGSSSHGTMFRNHVTGQHVGGGADLRCCASFEYYNRYWNVVGNIFGTPSSQDKLFEHSASTSEGSVGSIFKLGGQININNDFATNDVFSFTSGMFILMTANRDTITGTNGGVIWNASPNQNIAETNLAASLFLSSRPAIWPCTWDFPRIDPYSGSLSISSTNAQYANPAAYRYYNPGANYPDLGYNCQGTPSGRRGMLKLKRDSGGSGL